MDLKSYNDSREVRAFLALLHEQYADALRTQDDAGQMETCGSLCVAYAAMGNESLSRKWAQEYLSNLAV